MTLYLMFHFPLAGLTLSMLEVVMFYKLQHAINFFPGTAKLLEEYMTFSNKHIFVYNCAIEMIIIYSYILGS